MSIEIGPRISNPITYDEALLYCMTLSYKGYNDWRLPSDSEALFEFVVWVDDNDCFAIHYPTVTLPVTPVRDIK